MDKVTTADRAKLLECFTAYATRIIVRPALSVEEMSMLIIVLGQILDVMTVTDDNVVLTSDHIVSKRKIIDALPVIMQVMAKDVLSLRDLICKSYAIKQCQLGLHAFQSKYKVLRVFVVDLLIFVRAK